MSGHLARVRVMAAVVAFAAASGLVAGCDGSVTEVVVAIRSDLAVPGEAEDIVIGYQPGEQPPSTSVGGVIARLQAWPVSLGFSSGGTFGSFSINVQLLRFGTLGQMVVVSRSASAIRFVDGETRMLVLELPRTCACQGTTCPSPEDHPECANLVDPPLLPLDPAVAPPGSGDVSGNVPLSGQSPAIDAGRSL